MKEMLMFRDKKIKVHPALAYFNKSSTSTRMQYFDPLSMMLFPK